MLHELCALATATNARNILDATFGCGGYSSAFLNLPQRPSVSAIDCDPAAERHATSIGSHAHERFHFEHGRFGQLLQLGCVTRLPFDMIAFDLGLSTAQVRTFLFKALLTAYILNHRRGFSFRIDGPLDMRMDSSRSTDQTAHDIVNGYSVRELARVLRENSNEECATKIAQAIAKARSVKNISSTVELASIINNVVTFGLSAKSGIHPATRSFQAIRMEVNRELDELRAGLSCAIKALTFAGVVAVVTFHSLEEQVVKEFCNRAPTGHTASTQSEHQLDDAILRDTILPSTREVQLNRASRSAKMHVLWKNANMSAASRRLFLSSVFGQR